eukprot:scaffold6679_cov144-Amphora_coffeaeformis.AAC.3
MLCAYFGSSLGNSSSGGGSGPPFGGSSSRPQKSMNEPMVQKRRLGWSSGWVASMVALTRMALPKSMAQG